MSGAVELAKDKSGIGEKIVGCSKEERRLTPFVWRVIPKNATPLLFCFLGPFEHDPIRLGGTNYTLAGRALALLRLKFRCVPSNRY